MKDKQHAIPCILVAVFLFSAMGHWPYGFYQFLRLVTTAVGGYVAVRSFSSGRAMQGIIFAAIALLFNPILPVHMVRETWHSIDACCGLVFLVGALL